VESLTAMSDFLDQLQPQLRAVLGKLGADITLARPSVRWHVEFPKSRIYGLVGLLIFSSSREPEIELVVVTVQYRETSSWSIDVTDRESMPLVDEADLQRLAQNVDSVNADRAANGIRTILEPISKRIIEELFQ
jgi:hypothetical protein